MARSQDCWGEDVTELGLGFGPAGPRTWLERGWRKEWETNMRRTPLGRGGGYKGFGGLG